MCMHLCLCVSLEDNRILLMGPSYYLGSRDVNTLNIHLIAGKLVYFTI